MKFTNKQTFNSTSLGTANTPLERKCLEQGIRLTNTRRVILAVLEQSTSYMTVEEVYRCLSMDNADRSLSISTIYSNIRSLVESEVIGRRWFKAKQSYYSTTLSESQDQLIDIESGCVIEFRNEKLDKLKADIAREYGFSGSDCRIELYARVSKKNSHKK